MENDKEFIVDSTPEDLEKIGIRPEINGLPGIFVKKYFDGWICLKIKHSNGFFDFENNYDFPANFLKEKI